MGNKVYGRQETRLNLRADTVLCLGDICGGSQRKELSFIREIHSRIDKFLTINLDYGPNGRVTGRYI